jgi:transcriptional regulator with XRE-family HTH domain
MPPEEIVAHRIRQLREEQGWSQEDLANRLNNLGAKLDRSQIARVEKGPKTGRGVPIDELVQFALALNTSLIALMFPIDDDAPVEFTPDYSVRAVEARRWARGEAVLLGQDVRRYVLSQAPSDLQQMV